MKKKKTVTLPRVFHPGPGHPPETLAYLNPVEHELIRRLTDGKASRGPKGVRSYAVTTGTTTSGSTNDKKDLGGGGKGAGPGGGSLSAPARTAPSTGGSGVSGSKGGGASTQKPGAGGDAGQVDAKTVAKAAEALKETRTTGISKVADAARANAARAPNAAAQSAYDRQTMRAMSERYDPVQHGAAPNPKGALAGASPADFARTALGYNINRMDNMGVTDANRIVNGFNNLKQFADVTYDPSGIAKIRNNLGYTPIGIRSNNPGNITSSKAGWEKDIPGYAGPVKSLDPKNKLSYQSYTDPRWGLVAQNELLGSYYDGGRHTINTVVDRYAPVDENNSAAANSAYKQNLSNNTGWGVNDQLTREQVQSLGPYKTAFENGGKIFAGGPFGGTPVAPSNVQVAGLTNAGLGEAARRQQAKEAADKMQRLVNATLPTDPRVGLPQGSFPSARRGPAGTFTSPYDRIQSGVVTDPRVSMPQGGFPAAPRGPAGTYTSPYDRLQPTLPTDPRIGLSQGSFPSSRRGAAGTFTAPYDRISPTLPDDPRLGLPRGSFPSAKAYDPLGSVSVTPFGDIQPEKQRQVAWNVPPMGGAIGPAYGDAMRDFGKAHVPAPSNPAPSIGTSTSQTASATDSAKSIWQDPNGWIKANTGVDVKQKTAEVQQQIDAAKATPLGQFAINNPRLAAGLLGIYNMFNGMGGGNPNGPMGNPQDRSNRYFQPQQPQVAQAAPVQQMDPLQTLLNLQQNMLAKGASPEDLAYIQSLIDELNKQVA